MECDEKLIKSIIEKGRFSNKIAQAMHTQSNLEDTFIIPKGSAEIPVSKKKNDPGWNRDHRRSVFK